MFSLIVREMQIKTTLRNHFSPIMSYIPSGMQTCTTILDRNLAVPKEIIYAFTLDPQSYWYIYALKIHF